ncbi:hypothetical protein DICVIV_03793 [Dictyocaulus viviparus]|uniref:Phosphatidylethanolamine-binding protein n=1 Tax=Dictyocaulus viviparus TaxID=29172 RepID=A0A0D8Y1N2_DICVI|nr:hypothetical protein DICVIV_03793 [Dictyocaulus viviparus]
MPYGSPAPQPRTDIHRYVILMRINVPKPSSRAKFNVKQFIEKHKLGVLQAISKLMHFFSTTDHKYTVKYWYNNLFFIITLTYLLMRFPTDV